MSNDSLIEKLTKDCDITDWSSLHPHFLRDSLFIIDNSLDFIDVCVAASANDTGKISPWIEQGKIKRPDGFDVQKWHVEKPTFKCLVISPFVFIQKVI
jgi:hypothetical protein